MIDGWKETELASKLGRTPSWVSERLSELRTEILLQNGILPPLTDAEYAALRDSIRRQGVLLPVLVDENVELIDGRHRLRITDELNLPCPFWIVTGLTAEEKREIAVVLTASRRQLTRQQRRKLVEHELMHDGERSDRRIAAICGVSHPTVATVRTEIRAAAERWRELELPMNDAPHAPPPSPNYDVESSTAPIWSRIPTFTTAPVAAVPLTTDLRGQPADERRIDTLGRRQPARRSSPPRAARAPITVTCPTCDTTHVLVRRGNTYTLEAHA